MKTTQDFYAHVYRSARVSGEAWVCGDAQVSESACVYKEARIFKAFRFSALLKSISSRLVR